MQPEHLPQEPVVRAPAQPPERIAVVDMLRGFALFGILLVNMGVFSIPWTDENAARLLFPGSLDRAVAWAIRFLAESKFVSLFAFLFGLSTWLHGERLREPRLQRRRLWLLLLFGLAHALLLWSGDILVLYALLGLVLLRLWNRSTLTLAWISAVCLALPILASSLVTLIPGEATPAGELTAMGRIALQVYQGGTYPQILLFRVWELLLVYLGLIISAGIGHLFALFLIGLLAGRLGIFRNAGVELFRRIFGWGLAIGTAGSLLLAQGGDPPLAYAVGTAIGGSSMGLAYGAGLVLLARRPGWAERLQPLASAGRMAFTNYLMQTIICTTLFYGYGLGLYGRVGPAAGLLLTCTIYSLQVAGSHWWLRRFRFGPFEWVWRSLTYGRPQPIRR